MLKWTEPKEPFEELSDEAFRKYIAYEVKNPKESASDDLQTTLLEQSVHHPVAIEKDSCCVIL